MPSVQQIKDTQSPNKTLNSVQNKWRRPIKYLIIAALVCLGLRYFFAPKILDISQKIYDNTDKNSQFYSVITGGKKIVWFGADCPMSKSQKKAIDIMLQDIRLKGVYQHVPFLQNVLHTECTNKDCADIFLVENCSNNLCIVIPARRKIVKADFDIDLFKKLQKIKDW